MIDENMCIWNASLKNMISKHKTHVRHEKG